jgi:rhodanese-related sulfurtransferase
MKAKQFKVVVTLVVLLSAFAGATLQNACASAPSADDEMKISSFGTDKDIYSAREEMTIFLSLYSPEGIGNASITVSGVKSTKGVYYVSYSSNHNLTAGENTLTFTRQLPSCSRCAGISQGTYSIDASVTYDSEVVTATHSIAITSEPNHVIPVNIAVEEAKRMIESESEAVLLLDVRTTEEYNSGHIEGALSIPLLELRNRAAELNTSAKIIIYCADGSASTIASDLLIESGFEGVYNMLDGLNAWDERDYAVVSTATLIPEEPGFEAALALVALLIVAHRVRRR